MGAVHVVIDAIFDGGDLIGFAKVTRDITERREAQLKLDAARETLFQAQKIEAVGQLTGGIAHDFNNLLMAILGSLEIVTKRLPHDPKISPFIENAVQGAQRGAALTQRMLAFARRQELKMGPVDVLDTVRGMGELLERALAPSVYITTRFPVSLPLALTDKAQLESALLNLAVNARDAMPSGGQIVIAADHKTVATPGMSQLSPGTYVVLSVIDQGDGMDEETLGRATEPFFTTKGGGKSTGLGLPMVHGLAEQSGGKFLLSSVKGRGTAAELWLPLAGSNVTEVEAATAAQGTPISAKRVLVVDDDALVLLNTVTLTEDLGHHVIEAMSGKEALKILATEAVDIVITDFAMPQMNGGALATEILARWPHVKIIVATGYAEMPDEYRGKFERLGNPFVTRDLRMALERAMASVPGK